MMFWRAYLWGDRDAIDGESIKPEYIPNTTTLVNESGVVQAVAGIVAIRPGNYEVFLIPAGRKVASFEVYRALKQKFLEVAMMPGVERLTAYVDGFTDHGAELARAVGMKEEAYLPAWSNGEPRVLLGRVCK